MLSSAVNHWTEKLMETFEILELLVCMWDATIHSRHFAVVEKGSFMSTMRTNLLSIIVLYRIWLYV